MIELHLLTEVITFDTREPVCHVTRSRVLGDVSVGTYTRGISRLNVCFGTVDEHKLSEYVVVFVL